MATISECSTLLARGLLAAVLLTPLASSLHAADRPAIATQAVQQLRDLRSEEPPAESEVESFLVEHAPECAELSVQLLLERRVPGLGEDPQQTLSIQQERILLGAIDRMPSDLVRDFADDQLLGIDSERARAVACMVYGRIGDAFDLDLLFDLACEEDAEETTPGLRTAFRDGLTNLLRGPDVAIALKRAWPEAPESLLEPTILALGDSRDPRTLSLLKEVIVWEDEWAMLAISQVRLIGSSLDVELNRAVAESLAEQLDNTELRLAEAACLALGELGDDGHLEDFVELLDHPDRVIRSAAHHSLMQITGEAFPPSRRVWFIWLDREQAAQQAILAQLTPEALSGPAASVHALLRESTRSRIGRNELAEALTHALEHRSDAIRETTCEVLQLLGSPIAIDALIYALGDSEDNVRSAAEEALNSITGASGLEDMREWREFVEARTGLY